MTCDLEKYQLLSDKTYYTCLGRVSKVVGLTIESIGPEAKLNDLCKIYRDREQKEYVMAEVVGFKDNRLLLMPFDSIEGLGVGCIVANTGHPLSVLVGDEVLGHILDGIFLTAEILKAAGYKTGLFTSPHLVDVRERIRINNEMISKDDFVKAYEYVEAAVAAKDVETAKAALLEATSVIDKAESKGIYHKNNASRKVSRLSKAVNSIA